MIPTRTMKGSCEISTAALTLTSQPPAFQGEAGAMQVQVDFTLDGSAFSPDASTEAQVYLYYPASDVMTQAQTMAISGNTATATLSAEDQATPGAPYLVVQLTDTSSGALIVSCMAPLIIRQTRADTLTNGTAPTPSEVVYVGRAPYLSATNTWVVWDNTSSSFVDSGISAIGPKGDPGAVQTVNGNEPDGQGNAQLDGLIYETTAQALEAMSQEEQAALYAQGYRAIVATYNDTVTMHALAEDGSLTWIGNRLRNELDNPDFAIAQAGYGGMHGAIQYAADRWVSEGSTATVVHQDGITTITPNGQSSTIISQRVPDSITDLFRGKEMTAIVETENKTVVLQFLYPENDVIDVNSQISGNWKLSPYRTGSDTPFSIRIYNTVDAESISIKHISLISGSYTAKTLPPWVAPDPVMELIKCQDFFRTLSAYGIIGVAVVDSASSVLGTVFGEKMRIDNPSLTGDLTFYTASTGVNLTGVTQFMFTGNGFRFSASFAGGLEVGTFGFLIPSPNSAAISADL